tara:strand:- start:2151 stop:5267 length:3117 start_codon:yes stop_codon:yes gene_type:complete
MYWNLNKTEPQNRLTFGLILKIGLITLCFLFVITEALYAQSPPTKPPLEHEIQTYRAPDNTVFINQHQSYQFMFLGMQSEATQVLEDAEKQRSHLLPEGSTNVQISNADGSVISYPLVVDGTAPVSTIELVNAPLFTSDEGKLYVGKNMAVKYEAVDEASGISNTYWALNNGAFNPFNEENPAFINNQNYLLYYYAVDKVGNVEPVQSLEFEVDVTGPQVLQHVEGPQNLSVIAAEATISLTATDNASGVNSIFFWFDKNKASSYSTPISLNDLEDGDHILFAYATDNVKNAGDTLAYRFYLDRNSPDIAVKLSGNVFEQDATTYLSAESSITLIPNDNKSGAATTKYQINQNPERPYSNPIQLPSVSGTYTVTYYSGDVVGNTSDKQSVKLYLDNGRPNTNIRFQGYYSKKGDGYAINPETKITLEAGDLESGIKEVRYKIKDEPWEVYTAPISFTQKEMISLSYYSIDHVNNQEEEQRIKLTIQEIENTASFVQPERITPENSSFMKIDKAIQGPDKDVYLWLSSSDADDSEKFMLSFSSDSSTVFPINLQKNTENIIQVEVDESTTRYPITIDGTSPTSTIKASGATSVKQGETLIFAPGVNLTLSASDNITGVKEMYTSENGGRYQPYNKMLSGYYTEQNYAIRYYAVDEVGNEENEQLFQFNVDATAPITSHRFLSNFSGSNLSKHTTILLEADDNLAGIDTTYIQLNNGKPIVYNAEITLAELGDFEEAFNTISYYSVDRVGNREQKKQFNFKIDKIGPTVNVNWQGPHFEAEDHIYIHPTTELALKANDEEMEIRTVWYSTNGENNRQPYSHPVSFKAGSFSVLQFAAEDELGNQSEVHNLNVAVDGTAPQTQHVISGDRIESKNGFIFGPGATLSFSAADRASGVAYINYSINSETMTRYSQSIQFKQSGQKIVRFQAVDQVGNVEELQVLSVLYDETAPEIDISFSKQPHQQNDNEATIDAETLISITSIDRESEVKSLEYKLGEQDYKPYFRPIKMQGSSPQKLTIRSIDLFGNEQIKVITIQLNSKK